MIIKMKLKDIIHNDTLLEQCGLDPYCCSEGANPEDYIEVEVKKVVPYTDEELEELEDEDE